MPNWCTNRLEVSKHNESGRRLIDAFRENHVNDKGEKYASPFQDLRPCPEELIETVKGYSRDEDVQAQREAQYKRNKEKYGHTDWYEWRVANWGTKWDACGIDITDMDDRAMIIFETAWAPPSAFLSWYAEQNPDVLFCNHFEEEGMSFEGYDLNSPDRGFVSESWEPHQGVPFFDELLDEIEVPEK